MILGFHALKMRVSSLSSLQKLLGAWVTNRTDTCLEQVAQVARKFYPVLLALGKEMGPELGIVMSRASIMAAISDGTTMVEALNFADFTDLDAGFKARHGDGTLLATSAVKEEPEDEEDGGDDASGVASSAQKMTQKSS